MRNHRSLRPLLALSSVLLVSALVFQPARAQGGPSPTVRRAVDAVVRMLEHSDNATLEAFIGDHLAPAYRESFAPGALVAHLAALRDAARGSTGDVRVQRGAHGELELTLEDQNTVTLALALDDQGTITRLALLATGPGPSAEESGPALTWETLEESFRAAEKQGFSGNVLAVRQGKVVLLKSYGLADRESGRAIAPDTAFGIGSTPIDFTMTAVRLLGQRGKLRLEDGLDRYFPQAPADKRGITLHHLMTGASGLPDFHHIAEKDWDYDLAWIDRDTAVARILGQPLLFEPGKGREHSHSAFVLLAVIIEQVSGEPYADFVRREIFAPAGMTRTGFYGEALDLKPIDFATGYGPSSVGLPNIPPNWGPVSWLVLGSGGMFSTLPDMRRYYEALDAGRILQGEWLRRGPRMGIGGSDRGFYLLHFADGEGSRVLLLANGEGRENPLRGLERGLSRLVPTPPPGAPPN